MTEGYAITQEGLDALRAELEQLEGPARRDIAERIRIAREWGDLKENAEYHAAKEEQAHLETRILKLNERERNAVVVAAASDASVVAFGSTVEVRDEKSGKVATYTLVGAAEASARDGRLSIESPVARALIGAGEGEDVRVHTPTGVRTLHVVRVG
ncbi:transcription elongation factor GreA [Conexibacter sp. JD483]|uniref:transcription elongation factor GreA n=1 Tax=unclassified Conexibacter TaxID=2627773 RepID=UPI002728BEA3|nr:MULTISPECIES: transcription elongation factor GreA [unclassified Conexibacter]MDO8184951.1 transcription elongation factor GreA [Conexibacter sp. CPCC 205706]MDO8198095.1 transcription elongation factor GreA [Conexibacter sp. CPCC 205762]MDR9368283.1 transcription elongation factor GreA [Conexibacter sp. JD483]